MSATDSCDWCGKMTDNIQKSMVGALLCPSCCPSIDEDDIPDDIPPEWHFMNEHERKAWLNGMSTEEIAEKFDWLGRGGHLNTSHTNLFSRMVFGRQQPINDSKFPEKFILQEHIVVMLRENSLLDADDNFSGTPVEIGNENVIIAEDGTKYEV